MIKDICVIRTFVIVFSFLVIPYLAISQDGNDNCGSAFYIDNASQFCSGPGAFSNVGLLDSGVLIPTCWDDDQRQDSWYTFSPQTKGLFFQIFGAEVSTVESLGSFSFVLYEGRCNDLAEVICGQASNSINIIERSIDNLVVGGVYYLRVSSTSSNAGTFELCLEGFNPVPTPEQDCPDAVVLCDKSTFIVDFLQGGGRDVNEAAGSCLDNILDPGAVTETSSAWYSWTAEQSGTLEFTLIPNNTKDPEEDLDFAVYRLPNGVGDCTNKELLRCMASGESRGNTPAQNAPCFGPTGLSSSSTDFQEFPGCDPGDDNFVAAIDMISGESYALIVNNYSRSGFGFTINFGGTGTFRGPQPDFAIVADQGQECEKTIYFDDLSFSLPGDDIVEYSWSFGEGATPQFGEGDERQEVVYNSFGTKLVALTVETSRGCTVTEILEVEIGPCCSPDSDLEAGATTIDLSCFESQDGSMTITGSGGDPDYLYSFNGGDFQPSTTINNLSADVYDITVQDSKGCEDLTQVEIFQPAELLLTVSGPLDSIDLGKTAMFDSEVGPADRIFEYEWSPPNGLSCTDCPSPTVTSQGTRTYTLTVTDQDGCVTSESITLLSVLVRTFYAPNVLSTSSPNGNDQFKIITNQATELIESLVIYDRWGSEIYRADNVLFDENTDGWNGRNWDQKEINPGAYVWVANIRYVDGEVLTFNGTVTVLK